MPLVLVPTPLGNLGDMTLRALQTLRDAELIVAEDTRVTRKLLNALEIGSKELWSYREQNATSVTHGILERAARETVAVVTDAGMPGISDPGEALVAAAREAGVAVEVLPGPSAALGVAVLSGFPLRRFLFEGFPPRSAEARRDAFRASLAVGVTSIWYESPQRIGETLADLSAVAPDARVFVVREYTKKFEEHVAGTAAEVRAALGGEVRGEIAFAVAPVEVAKASEPLDDPDTAIDAMLAQGFSVREVAKAIADSGGGDRRELYARAVRRKREAAAEKGAAE